MFRHGLQGAERLVLGAPELADGASGSRSGPVARKAEDVVAAPLALDRTARPAQGLQRLGLRRPLPGALRPVHVPGARRARIRHDPLRRSDRRLRTAPLPRYLQLRLRPRLAARELLRLPRAARDVLLRLLPARSDYR